MLWGFGAGTGTTGVRAICPQRNPEANTRGKSGITAEGECQSGCRFDKCQGESHRAWFVGDIGGRRG